MRATACDVFTTHDPRRNYSRPLARSPLSRSNYQRTITEFNYKLYIMLLCGLNEGRLERKCVSQKRRFRLKYSPDATPSNPISRLVIDNIRCIGRAKIRLSGAGSYFVQTLGFKDKQDEAGQTITNDRIYKCPELLFTVHSQDSGEKSNRNTLEHFCLVQNLKLVLLTITCVHVALISAKFEPLVYGWIIFRSPFKLFRDTWGVSRVYGDQETVSVLAIQRTSTFLIFMVLKRKTKNPRIVFYSIQFSDCYKSRNYEFMAIHNCKSWERRNPLWVVITLFYCHHRNWIIRNSSHSRIHSFVFLAHNFVQV